MDVLLPSPFLDLPADGFAVGGEGGPVGLLRLPFQGEKVLPGLVGVLVGSPLVHVVGVALDGDDPRVHHFLGLFVGEVGGDGVIGVFIMLRVPYGRTDDEDGGHHTVFLQDRVGVFIVAQVPVVKRDDNGFLRQFLALPDVGGQILGEHRGVTGLCQGGDLGFEGLWGELRTVIPLLRDVVVHEHRDLGRVLLQRKRFCLSHLGHMLCYVVSGDIGAKVFRNVHTLIPKHPGQGHVANALPEVGFIVEVPGLKAHGAVGEIPIIGDLGQPGVKVRHLLPGEGGQIVRIHRGSHHGQLDPIVFTELLNPRQALQGAGDGFLIGLVGKGRVIGEDGIGLQVRIHVPDGLRVPHLFVIGAVTGVKDVEGLGQIGVLHHGLQLVQTMAGVHEKVFGVEGERVFPGGLRRHGIGEGIRLLVVVHRVVDVDADHQVLYLVVFH